MATSSDQPAVTGIKRGLQSLRELFDRQKAAVTQGQDAVNSMRAELAELRTRRSALHSAAANREDLKNLVRGLAASAAAAFEANIAAFLAPIAREPQRYLAGSANASSLLGLIVPPANRKDPASCGQVEGLVLALFEPAVLTALLAVVDKMDLPNEGLPMASRVAEIARLDAQIAELEADLRNTLQAAEAAGLLID